MLEPLAVAVHAVRQMGDVTGMNIAVLGAGPIGNLVAQAAKGLGAAKVMITDVSDYRFGESQGMRRGRLREHEGEELRRGAR